MSNQFNEFLVDNLITWLQDEIKPGYRYRFHSDDPDNIKSIDDILLQRKTSYLYYEEIKLSYVEINSIKLIFVNDVKGEMNENYISNLRDSVSAQNDVFINTSLLVLHKSRLDTVLNSARDLSSINSPFHPNFVKHYLENLISENSNKTVFKELMRNQSKIIEESRQSAFSYEILYNSIINDKINFKDLGLLNDPALINESDYKKVRSRLEENQYLHDEIENIMINFPTEIEDRLSSKYSEDFIKKNITYDNWENVTYNELDQEIKKNKGSSILFKKVYLNEGELISRDESMTAKGKRTKNIIVFSNEQLVNLFFEFDAKNLKTEQFKILDNKNIEETSYLAYIGGYSKTLELQIPFNDKPVFFKLSLKGTKSSDDYIFKILLLKESSFYLKNIYNHFIIKSKEEKILLQLNEFDINFSENTNNLYEIEDEELIDIRNTPNINVLKLYNTQDEVSFKITNGIDTLNFMVEGKKIEQVISIPLIYNVERLNKIFDNAINAELNYNARKVILENREFPLIGKRFTYIDYEYSIINDLSLISNLEKCNEKIYEAYKKLLVYFQENNTVPSLCAWDNTVCNLASNFVNIFEEYMSSIPSDSSLTIEQKEIFNIGRYNFDRKEYMSPFSPLILSYILYLKKVSKDDSFKDIAEVTLGRLNPKGLFPYLYKGNNEYSYTRLVSDDSLWLEFVSNEESEYSYVSKLCTEKIIEFTKAFEKLFEFRHDAPLKINSINNGCNTEIFRGLVEYYKKNYEDKPKRIIVNLYDETFHETEFDNFADLDSYEELQQRYKFNENAETIIDVMRTHITYSKHELKDSQEYAHLSFFKNNEKVEIRPRKVNLQKSGLVCDGLISGESAEEENGYYYSGFGLRNIDIEDKQHLKIAKLYNALQRSVVDEGTFYDEDETISLMISENFKILLNNSYKNSLWTVIIDPKVTLDFFDNEKDLILIHYSDQYSSSANYDAITVTAKKDLYANVVGNENIIREFNAFNGEWLIKMIAEKQDKNKKEKRGVIAAYKYMTSLVDIPELTWVPLSVAEMVRVSGNIGLSMSQSDFSRYNSNLTKDEEYKHIGPISDDILLVGFSDNGVVLYPVEVKSGSASKKKAYTQSKALKTFFYDNLFKEDNFKSLLLKGLFIRQVFMQIDKYELYDVFEDNYFTSLHRKREELLKGTFPLIEFENYTEGAVIFFNESPTQFNSDFNIVDNIFECVLSFSNQQKILETSYKDLKEKMENGEIDTNTSFILENPVFTAYESNTINEIKTDEKIKEDNEVDIIKIEEISQKLENTDIDKESKEPMQIKFGEDHRTKEDIIWFPTDTTKTLNTNTGIIGTMGTGKTQFTKSLVTQLVNNSHNNVNGSKIDMIIFDYKGDYLDDEFVNATNATILKPYKLPFNPLSLFGKMDLLPIHITNQFITTISKVYTNLGQIQKTKLDDVITQAYEKNEIDAFDETSWKNNAPTLNDVWEIYSSDDKNSIDTLYAALKKIQKFKIFEEDSSLTKPLFDVINGVTVIKLSGYDTDIQNLIVAITLDLFYTQMHNRGSSKIDGDFRQITKMILVDEADNFMSQEFESLKKILKEGREFGVGTILSTQQLTHFKTSEDNYADYIQSWIVHQVATIKLQDITSIFNISNKSEAENLMNQIRKLEKHYSIYVDGKKKMMKMRDFAFWELIK